MFILMSLYLEFVVLFSSVTILPPWVYRPSGTVKLKEGMSLALISLDLPRIQLHGAKPKLLHSLSGSCPGSKLNKIGGDSAYRYGC